MYEEKGNPLARQRVKIWAKYHGKEKTKQLNRAIRAARELAVAVGHPADFGQRWLLDLQARILGYYPRAC